MKFRSTKLLRPALGAIAGLVAFCAAPQAEELAALAGRTVALGAYRGTVYYHPDAGGYKVVVTMDDGAAGHVVRFMTTLAPGQRAVFSSPGVLTDPPENVSFTRDGDRLLVDDKTAHAFRVPTVLADPPSSDLDTARGR